MAYATRSDRPATPASGKFLLHDVNEPDMDRMIRAEILDWTIASLNRRRLVEPDGIEPTTSSLQS